MRTLFRECEHLTSETPVSMQADLLTLIQRIHASPTRLAMAVTGGGSAAIARLLEVPGASQTVLEATVPYSAAALAEYLGAQPEQACSPLTARRLAMAAYRRAEQLSSKEQPLMGVGATASLASDRPKRGEHRLHLAWQTSQATSVWSLRFAKGHRTRAEEESLCALAILNAIASGCNVEGALPLPLTPDERVEQETFVAPQSWQELLAGRRSLVHFGASSDIPKAVFPGAFHPLHDGHRMMARIASARLGAPAYFELSIENVDKPPLDFLEIRNRAAQFGDELILTRAATFVEKAQLFPGATFIVGADTIVRIGEDRYYPGPQARQAAIDRIAQAGCRFLVFARHTGENEVAGLEQLTMPPELRALCDEVPASEFLMDVSSTAIRRGE